MFLNGLKPVIQYHVRSFVPKTINQAFSLVILQETSLKTLQQELNPSKKAPILPTPVALKPSYKPQTTTQPIPWKNKPSNKSKTTIDFDEKHAKGLCFRCDDNYVRGHKCKKKELFMIKITQISDEEKSGDVCEENSVAVEEIDDDNPQTSVYAINRVITKGYQTMRVTVYVNKKPLNILID